MIILYIFAKNSTMRTIIRFIRNNLQPFYSAAEIESFIRQIFAAVKNFSPTDIILRDDTALSIAETDEIIRIVERLKNYEPIQYILGETEFMGLHLKVNPSVLIPRPETEELVQWIFEQEKMPETILDIGTGSGCIALALKKLFPKSEVSACDKYAEALSVAEENSAMNKLDVRFFQADILDIENFPIGAKQEMIVSNPPYVLNSEKKLMDANVLNYEPHSALFVPDNNPLLFYEAIAAFSQKRLIAGGWIFFEINEKYGEDIVKMLDKSGFVDIELKKDLQGKDRMIKAMKNSRISDSKIQF